MTTFENLYVHSNCSKSTKAYWPLSIVASCSIIPLSFNVFSINDAFDIEHPSISAIWLLSNAISFPNALYNLQICFIVFSVEFRFFNIVFTFSKYSFGISKFSFISPKSSSLSLESSFALSKSNFFSIHYDSNSITKFFK